MEDNPHMKSEFDWLQDQIEYTENSVESYRDMFEKLKKELIQRRDNLTADEEN